MIEVVPKKRKPPVLTPSRIPCLRQLPTINITRGCALGCIYCYIQGYPGYPGSGRVVLYENTAEIVTAELSRKRRKPRRVYFSPSSDAFQYLPEVQEVSFQTMAALLSAGVEVAFLTKGFVHERFIRLFAGAPDLVFAQVGITTLNRCLSATIEPRAASPEQRLAAIARLNEVGVTTIARLDPLIPDMTDTEQRLVPLLQALRAAGVATAAASYLFLRPPLPVQMESLLRLGHASRHVIDTWQHQRFLDGGGGGRMIAPAERSRRFARLRTLGEAAGIRISPCRCKNPDLGGGGCCIAGPGDIAERGGAQGKFSFAAVPHQDGC